MLRRVAVMNLKIKLFLESSSLLQNTPTQVGNKAGNNTKDSSNYRTYHERQNTQIYAGWQGLESFNDVGIVSDVSIEEDRMNNSDPGTVQYGRKKGMNEVQTRAVVCDPPGVKNED